LKGAKPYNKKQVEEAEESTKAFLQILEDALLTRTFLASERITLADIAVASFVQRGNEFVFGKAIRDAYPNVFRHYATVANQEWYKKVAGSEPAYIENAIVYTPPPKADKPKEEKKPKAAAAEPKPKAEKPKKEEDEEEDDTPKEAKPKHPIEVLGPAKSFPREPGLLLWTYWADSCLQSMNGSVNTPTCVA
jgi:elongation factor 1-gamma